MVLSVLRLVFVQDFGVVMMYVLLTSLPGLIAFALSMHLRCVMRGRIVLHGGQFRVSQIRGKFVDIVDAISRCVESTFLSAQSPLAQICVAISCKVSWHRLGNP